MQGHGKPAAKLGVSCNRLAKDYHMFLPSYHSHSLASLFTMGSIPREVL